MDSLQVRSNYVNQKHNFIIQNSVEENSIDMPAINQNNSGYKNATRGESFECSNESYVSKMMNRPPTMHENLNSSSRKNIGKKKLKSNSRRRSSKLKKKYSKNPWFLNMYDTDYMLLMNKKRFKK